MRTVDGSTPDAVAAHLAIRAAGHRPVPATANGDLPTVDLPPVDDPHSSRAPEAFEPREDPLAGGDGADGADDGRSLAARLAAVPPPAKPPRGTGGRPVLGAWLDLNLADHRTVLAWVLISRAALVLDPERRDLPGTAAWSRVTAVALPAEDLPLLAALVRTHEAKRLRRRRWLGPLARLRPASPRRRPPPLGGRLQTVLALTAPPSPSSPSSPSAHGTAPPVFRRLSGEEIGFWTARGVHLERPGRFRSDRGDGGVGGDGGEA